MREIYNYKKALRRDILHYLSRNNITLTCNNFSDVFKQMAISDDVTGIKSCSYTGDSDVAKDNVYDNFEFCQQLFEKLGISHKLFNELILNGEFEYIDCFVRAYLLVLMLPTFIL